MVTNFPRMMNYAGIIAFAWLSCSYLGFRLTPRITGLDLAEADDS